VKSTAEQQEAKRKEKEKKLQIYRSTVAKIFEKVRITSNLVFFSMYLSYTKMYLGLKLCVSSRAAAFYVMSVYSDYHHQAIPCCTKTLVYPRNHFSLKCMYVNATQQFAGGCVRCEVCVSLCVPST